MIYKSTIVIEIIKACLVHGWSHRRIQLEILRMPAPARGGGFEAMQILHSYGISGEDKNKLRNMSDAAFLDYVEKHISAPLVKSYRNEISRG